jgi:hypothetical protein
LVREIIKELKMTWVVGSPTPWGYAAALSDIQVTISTRNELGDPIKKYTDCLQKIYFVGPSIIAGFAGSVRLGFKFIGHLQNYLAPEENDPIDMAWIPEWVAANWSMEAKEFYEDLPPSEKAHVEILIAGVHPNEDNGIPGMPLSYAWTLSGPNFIPQAVPNGRAGSIGSGAKRYKEFLETIHNDDGWHSLHQFQTLHEDGFGRALLVHLSEKIERDPATGISDHLHLAICRRHSVVLMNNDHIKANADGTSTAILMPIVANSWESYLKIMASNGFGETEAEAGTC